jgi:hypothetical protein
MTADPVGWVGTKLSDLARLLAEAGVPPDAVGPADAADLRAAVPEIVGTVRTMLDRIRAGQLARPTEAAGEPGARSSWL